MSTALTAQPDSKTIETVLITGDLEKLTVPQRLTYYNSVCESINVNPLTRPFDYLRLNNKLILYVNKGGTDQLRKINGVSITRLEKDRFDDLYVVTAYGKDKTGREDSATGAVTLAGLRGDALANALMKAETKAKRRLTLSLCGLGMLDESEVETIKDAQVVPHQVALQASPEDHKSASDARIEQVVYRPPTELKTYYPSKFPAYLAKDDQGRGRFIEDFSTDELLKAADELDAWKGKPSFTRSAEKALELVIHLLESRKKDHEDESFESMVFGGGQ